jgi:WD40 repeat protein
MDGNPDPDDSTDDGFRNLDHGAADIILAVAFNSSGTRIAIGSADHKIRVYDVEQGDDWVLIDQWRGHDAEVLDASLAGLVHLKKLCAEKNQGSMDWLCAWSSLWNYWGRQQVQIMA